MVKREELQEYSTSCLLNEIQRRGNTILVFNKPMNDLTDSDVVDIIRTILCGNIHMVHEIKTYAK